MHNDMYNVELLVEMADSEDVADAIGLPTKRKGKHVYCECPSHRKVLGREDGNISNCILTDRGYKCFSCGASGDVLQMVMDYCNVPFTKALEVVASVTGGNFKISSSGSAVKKHPFSAEDLALIGMTSVANPEGDAGREIIGVSKFRPETGAFFRRGDEYVLYSTTKRITLNQLFAEDEKMYYSLVKENAEAALEKYKSLHACFNNRSGELFQKVFDILSVEGSVDGSLITEIKNNFLLNIKRVEKILEKCRTEV